MPTARFKTVEIPIARIPMTLINPKTGLRERYELEAPIVSSYKTEKVDVTRVSIEDKFSHLGRFMTTAFPTTQKRGFTQYPLQTQGLVIGVKKVRIPNKEYNGISYPALYCIADGELSVNRLIPAPKIVAPAAPTEATGT